MKKTAVLFFAAAVLVAVPSQARAQSTFGPVAAFHDDADFGVGAFLSMGMPSIHENVNLLVDGEIYFPGDNFDYFTVNGGLTYDFAANGTVTPFALGQLGIRRASYDCEGLGCEGFDGASDTDVGLNLGGGVKFGGSLQPTLGARFEIGDGTGFVVFGSLGFPMGGN